MAPRDDAAARGSGEAMVRDQRSEGRISVALADRLGRPTLVRAFQAGAGKLRVPRSDADHTEVCVLNTAGGLAGGDRFSLEARAAAGTLTVSTVACEKVYRSDGPAAAVTQTITVEGDAHARVVPQPTIVFDGAALHRHTRAEVATGARLTICEGLVLGRAARGETLARVDLIDRMDVVVGGRLVFVDALRLTTSTLARAAEPAGLAGARAIGLVLHVAEEVVPAHEPPESVATARTALEGGDWFAGVSRVGPVTVVRCLAPSHTSLQYALARAVVALSGRATPRAWQL